MNETIYEFVTSRDTDVRVDAEAGVIRGVKVLGKHSRNGREYLPEALSEAIAMYEGAKVNVNHPKGQPTAPRDYQDRIGVIRSVRMGADGCLYADFHFNPKHALAEQLTWDARHAPENVGFSHNVEARTRRIGSRLTVEAITRVQSVDLVADPATTRGLFEGHGASGNTPGNTGNVPTLAEVTLEQLQQRRPDLVDAAAESRRQETEDLREEVSRLESELNRARRRELIRRLFAESTPGRDRALDTVDVDVLGSEFMRLVEAAESDDDVRRLVEERINLVRSLRDERVVREMNLHKPTSRSPSWLSDIGGSPDDARSFAQAIA